MTMLNKTYDLKQLYELKKSSSLLFLLGCLIIIIFIPIDTTIKLYNWTITKINDML